MTLQPIRVFVASPGDVEKERQYVREVAAALNRVMAAERGVFFEIVEWGTHARGRVDPDGPQGPIDKDVQIAGCQVVVGILWKRLGTPIAVMGGQTGTEHEIRVAIAAKGPEVSLFFSKAPYAMPDDEEEMEQAAKVLRFRKEIAGLHTFYSGPEDFEKKIRAYLEQYLKAKHPVIPERKMEAGAGDPTRYLELLREESSYFDVQGLTFGESKAYRFPIDEFYIELKTTSMGGVGRPLQDVMRGQRRLFVVGDPGAGKSTFLKRAAFDACHAYKKGGPLPLAMSAAVLATYIADERKQGRGPADVTSPDWIPTFLGAQCEGKSCELGAAFFRAELKAGRCVVLIDGMDETADEVQRERLAKLIFAAAAAWDKCAFVVTSRPEGKVPIGGFEEVLIADLEMDAIRWFLGKLAKKLYETDERREREFREELEGAVSARREIRKMARNAVMLTALAVLQHNNVKLPERRVDLYDSILGWLAKKRPKEGRLPAWECLLRLRELALAMQNYEGGRRRQVPLAWAGEQLAKRFGGREAAERFLKAEQADSGIVVSRGAEVTFWHLTFQEFLAATEIAGWEDKDQFPLLVQGGKIHHPEWRETVVLYAGLLLYKFGPQKVDAFLREVLDAMGRKPSLAERAKCVGLIGALLPDLIGYKVTDERYAESLQQVMDIFDLEKSKAVPFQNRLAAAEALGLAGDLRLQKLEWVEIPESREYWLGAQCGSETARNYDPEAWDWESARKVDVPAFRIGKYPVTVSQYAVFVEDGSVPDRAPRDWERQLEHPNRPVVGVDWRQAQDYCEFVGGRLPREEEWERAARGQNCRKYPWGIDAIDPTRANYDESVVGAPTPAGLYPSGASEEGALDLVGNVYEWTSSRRDEVGRAYVVRGGAFAYDCRHARPACRRLNHPGARHQDLGFRVAQDIPSHPHDTLKTRRGE